MSAVAWAGVKRLTFWRRSLLRWLVGQVQRGFALREAGKSGMVASLWPTRHLVLEIGRRLVAGGHLERPEHAFHLSKADLLSLLRGRWDGGGAGALAHDRMAQRQAWLKCMPPDVIIEGEGAGGVVPVQQPLAVFDGQVWRGIGVSSGRVTAVARAVRHPEEGARLGPRGDPRRTVGGPGLDAAVLAGQCGGNGNRWLSITRRDCRASVWPAGSGQHPRHSQPHHGWRGPDGGWRRRDRQARHTFS